MRDLFWTIPDTHTDKQTVFFKLILIGTIHEEKTTSAERFFIDSFRHCLGLSGFFNDVLHHGANFDPAILRFVPWNPVRLQHLENIHPCEQCPGICGRLHGLPSAGPPWHNGFFLYQNPAWGKGCARSFCIRSIRPLRTAGKSICVV